jgi:hypothetical protein
VNSRAAVGFKVMNALSAKGHVEGIQQQYLQSPELTRESLTGAIDRLQKAFPRRGHFIMEFIQNADDAKSRRMSIEINQQGIVILNDGSTFSKVDLESICRVGRSSKTVEDYIGYLGVGFKSVFLISECPAVYSGNYQFKFDKSHWPDPMRTPWQVMPIWTKIEKIEEVLKGEYKTAFIVPVSEIRRDMIDKISEEVTPEHLNNRILLFLRHINEIEIHNHVTNTTRKIIKYENTSPSEDYESYVLEEQENGVLAHQDKWLVMRSVCEVPNKVKEDYITKDWERDTVKNREVVVAFKLDDEGCLVEEIGTAHIGVFSFLPLKEIPSGLRFLIQADFLTAPGREIIQREALWNEWLAREILNLITGKCIKGLMAHKKWRLNASKVLYPGIGEHPIFDEHIKTPLSDYLSTNPVLIAEDNTHIKADEALILGAEVSELLSAEDLQEIYPGKKIIHPDCITELEVEEGPSTLIDFVKNDIALDLMNEKAQSKDIKWFKKLYNKLANYDSDELVKQLNYEDIILTSKNTLTRPTIVYIKPKNLHIPAAVKDRFQLVHPRILNDPDALQFLKKIGVKELTREHIKELMKTKEFPEISENWSQLGDSDRVKKIKLCKELWEKQQIDISDLAFLTLKTKSGKWLQPNDIVFSKEYKPNHNIEILVEQDLLDLPIEFLNPNLIRGVKDKQDIKWREFLSELGVDNKLETRKKDIIERIGIKVALHFEDMSGRKARELGESEKLGYDIVSSCSSEERHIEVKGSNDPGHRLNLTKNEYNTLRKEPDNYYVYMIEDAFRMPYGYVIRGTKILDAALQFVSFAPSEWKPLKEQDFRL